MNGSGACNLQFLQSRSRQHKRKAFSGFFLASAVLSAFVGCVSPIRLYGVPVSGMNAFVELLFVVCCFRGLCFFVVIEFAFCLYSCGFSVRDHRSLTLPSWSGAVSPDSVIVISSSSHRPSCDFSVWDYRSLTLPSWPNASSRILSSPSPGLGLFGFIFSDLRILYLALESSLSYVVSKFYVVTSVGL